MPVTKMSKAKNVPMRATVETVQWTLRVPVESERRIVGQRDECIWRARTDLNHEGEVLAWKEALGWTAVSEWRGEEDLP